MDHMQLRDILEELDPSFDDTGKKFLYSSGSDYTEIGLIEGGALEEILHGLPIRYSLIGGRDVNAAVYIESGAQEHMENISKQIECAIKPWGVAFKQEGFEKEKPFVSWYEDEPQALIEDDRSERYTGIILDNLDTHSAKRWNNIMMNIKPQMEPEEISGVARILYAEGKDRLEDPERYDQMDKLFNMAITLEPAYRPKVESHFGIR